MAGRAAFTALLLALFTVAVTSAQNYEKSCFTCEYQAGQSEDQYDCIYGAQNTTRCYGECYQISRQEYGSVVMVKRGCSDNNLGLELPTGCMSDGSSIRVCHYQCSYDLCNNRGSDDVMLAAAPRLSAAAPLAQLAGLLLMLFCRLLL